MPEEFDTLTSPEQPQEDLLGDKEIDLNFNLGHLTPETALQTLEPRPFEFSPPAREEPVSDQEIKNLYEQFPYMGEDERAAATPRLEAYKKQEAEKEELARQEEGRRKVMDAEAKKDL